MSPRRFAPLLAPLLIALASPAAAITLSQAVTATTASGYTVLGVRTKSDTVSVLATDGTSLYDIRYASDGTATSETLTPRDDTVLSTSSAAEAAIAAAETAGYSVVGLRVSADGSSVSMRATDGTALYEISYDAASATTTTTAATERGPRGDSPSAATSETQDAPERSEAPSGEQSGGDSGDHSGGHSGGRHGDQRHE